MIHIANKTENTFASDEDREHFERAVDRAATFGVKLTAKRSHLGRGPYYTIVKLWIGDYVVCNCRPDEAGVMAKGIYYGRMHFVGLMNKIDQDISEEIENEER